MRRTAGVLAFAIATITLGAAPAAATAPYPALGNTLGGALLADCEQGGGLLSGVTGGLCELVDGVTDTVDSLTGDQLGPVTDGLDDTVGGVTNPLGEVLPTPQTPEPTPPPKPGDQSEPADTADAGKPGGGEGLLPSVLDEVCLPVLACKGQGVLDGLTPPPPKPGLTTPPPKPRPEPKPSEKADEDEQAVLPTTVPVPPDSRPYLLNSTEHDLGDEPAADPDRAGLGLLWPGPLTERLRVRLSDQQVVRPSDTDGDVLGTALTATLLASAVLATRIVHKRRRKAEESASIPFEPMRVGGRHRLA
ncbi:hypothetical protein [Nonomuraea sp. NPDC050310]|uniref:hypothetical protein n=1 Tax=unclassified Nonomuraea TaxID=2593643 RepID=UPI0033F40F5B